MWPFRTRVYGCHWYGFGDLWASCSHAARLAQQREVRFSAFAGIDTRRRHDRSALIGEILGQLDLDTAEVRIVPERMNTGDRYGVRDHCESYVPTRVRWRGGAERLITYQLETHSSHRPERFLADAQRERFLAWCGTRGWRAFDLSRAGSSDGPPLAQCIEWLAESACFVGIDSGASHLAHSVGVPTYLRDWAELELAHRGKRYTRFRDVDALCAALEGGGIASHPGAEAVRPGPRDLEG